MLDMHYLRISFVCKIKGWSSPSSLNNTTMHSRKFLTIIQGHPTTIFGKYLFGRRFDIQNFRNIFCKISCLPASPRIFERLKKRNNCLCLTDYYPKKSHLEFSGAFFLAGIFEQVSLDLYNFRITRLSARKSEQMKNFQGIKICLCLPFKY